MDPETIQDAARLAAKVPRHTAISPRDGEIGPVWLDLRNESTVAGLGRIRWVTDALAACLAFQESARLFVTAGATPSDAVAICAASSSISADQGSTGVAVIRGESLLSRIEEFFVAGCELRSELPPHRSLREVNNAPKNALTPAPSSVLSAAIEAGAKVIVSRSAEPDTIAAALGTNPSAEPTGRVSIQMPTGYEAQAVLPRLSPTEEPYESLLTALPASVSCVMTSAGDLSVLHLRSNDHATIKEGCRLGHLLLDGFALRMADSIRQTTEDWPTSVPPEMLEFGYDLRPATDWLAGNSGDTP